MSEEGREAVDATRRTRLANERTYLAWWRSGLTALAVSFGAGKLVPELTSGPAWPYVVIGVLFAVLGIVFIGYGVQRQREVERALGRGDYAPFDERAAALLGAFGVLLGIATVVVLLAGS